ncbi:hypothetical protein BJX61DRAFT_544660 [Aspergillus egyptiacus]|nr:hypothetical protein BJX61DRAFT_544660 [Aspergillus egyptiacus]
MTNDGMDGHDSAASPQPISRVVARFIEPAPPSLSLSAAPSSASLAHWHTLRNLLYLLRFGSPSSADHSSTFSSALDRIQKTSLALLEEWWAGRAELHDRVLVQIKRRLFGFALCTAAGSGASGETTFDSRLAGLEALALEPDLSLLREEAAARRAASLAGHDGTGGDLGSPSGERVPETEEEILDSVEDIAAREIAAGAAPDERLGYHALRHAGLLVQARKSTTGPSVVPGGNKIQLSKYPRPIPMILKPCDWLKEEQAEGVPFYLWDIKHKRTIKTSGIQEREIQYAIVSHTWGRYREGDSMEAVCGVPWRVPRISLFDVRQIPLMLLKAGFEEPYIWMDLICIPQEMAVDWQLAICKAELPRQLAIFRNASTAVVWMSDVASWEGTEAALLWLGVKSTHFYSKMSTKYQIAHELDELLEVAAEMASSPCELAQATTGAEEDETEEQETAPPGWFTSLWTLQEFMIRPDMIMLDRNWRLLVVGNALIVTVENLIMLGGGFVGLEDAPEGTETLLSILRDQQMVGIRMDGPLISLIVGAQRTSTSPRAPAIMSAVGATDWFKGRTLQQFQSPEEANQLVLGLYPLDFVEEVRGLGQAAFFSCTITIATLVRGDGDDPRSQNTPAPGYPLRGTMLPFMPVPEEAPSLGTSSPYPRLDGLSEHPTVRSWQIHLDGSVTIPKVAIIASNVAELQLPCPLEFVISSNSPTDISCPYRVLMRVPLDEWICEFDGEAYAVCTMLHEERIAGIILHRWDKRRPFVKAGTFEPFSSRAVGRGPGLIDPESITVLDVDWRVY